MSSSRRSKRWTHLLLLACPRLVLNGGYPRGRCCKLDQLVLSIRMQGVRARHCHKRRSLLKDRLHYYQLVMIPHQDTATIAWNSHITKVAPNSVPQNTRSVYKTGGSRNWAVALRRGGQCFGLHARMCKLKNSQVALTNCELGGATNHRGTLR